MGRKQIFLLLAVLIFANLFSGCTYLKNRKNDAMDMFDVGITVSAKPGFSAYVDGGLVLPIGVSYVDGKLLGIGRSTFGVHDFRQKGVGYVIGGSLQRGVDNYDPEDPYAPKRYDTGLLGYAKGTTFAQLGPAEEETERPRTRATCPKTLHLGWIGFDFG